MALSENLEPYGNTAIYVQGISHFKEVSLKIVWSLIKVGAEVHSKTSSGRERIILKLCFKKLRQILLCIRLRYPMDVCNVNYTRIFYRTSMERYLNLGHSSKTGFKKQFTRNVATAIGNHSTGRLAQQMFSQVSLLWFTRLNTLEKSIISHTGDEKEEAVSDAEHVYLMANTGLYQWSQKSS